MSSWKTYCVNWGNSMKYSQTVTTVQAKVLLVEATFLCLSLSTSEVFVKRLGFPIWETK